MSHGGRFVLVCILVNGVWSRRSVLIVTEKPFSIVARFCTPDAFKEACDTHEHLCGMPLEEEELRFVQLADCRHIFSTEFFDGWLESKLNEINGTDGENSTEGDLEISTPACSICKKPMKTTLRANALIKQTADLIEKARLAYCRSRFRNFRLPQLFQAKRKIWNNQSPKTLESDRKMVAVEIGARLTSDINPMFSRRLPILERVNQLEKFSIYRALKTTGLDLLDTIKGVRPRNLSFQGIATWRTLARCV